MSTAIAFTAVDELVDRGLELRAAIQRHEEELDHIEEQLKTAGLQGEQVDLADEEREGRQFRAEGTAKIVPVVFTADLLTQSFRDGSPKHKDIAAAAGGNLRKFYLPATTWEITAPNGKQFRRRAAEVLGPDGPEFVSACVARDKFGVPKSAIKVEWHRAEAKSTVGAGA